ncbi:MAG: hypothetical protein WKF96_00285 [Solirubrobacteraceae bacterium]
MPDPTTEVVAAAAPAAPQIIMHPATGELLDLSTADPVQLAVFASSVEELKGKIADITHSVSAELVRRLDRRGSWTLRLGEPSDGVQYEVKAQSPDAGTTAYDELILETGLAQLVADRVIDAEAAEQALSRIVIVHFKVPVGTDPATILDAARADERVVHHEYSRSVRASGMKALSKIGGGARALAEEVTSTRPAANRSAKVKIITKEK